MPLVVIAKICQCTIKINEDTQKKEIVILEKMGADVSIPREVIGEDRVNLEKVKEVGDWNRQRQALKVKVFRVGQKFNLIQKFIVKED